MSSISINLLLAVLLLAANAFYVAAEFALVKSRGFRVKAMVEQNRFGARLLQTMMGNIESYLACCQLGITMASLGLGWIGEPTVSALLSPILQPLGLSEATLHFTSFVAGFLVFSSLHIIIGEQVPKTLAIREPMPVSQWIAYPLYASYLVFYPLSWCLNTASGAILRLIGVQEFSQHEILTDSEIEGLVEESAVHGKIESGEAEYIHNVFRLGELTVSDVMVHRTAMVMINADLPPEELVREVLATEYTRIPLWRDKSENIIGILHAKDLLRAIRVSEGDTSRIDVTTIMLPPWFVPEMRPISQQLKAFRRRKTHFALVVDEYGEVEGLVTLEDILEEIVGDISDEHDVVVAGVRRQPDGSVVVDGSVPIRDLNRALDWHLPDEEATTVAGLVIHEARSIPDRGQSFTFHGFRFRVLRRERNRITALRISPVAREAELEEAKPRRAGTSF
ncbi:MULTISPECIES: hemolysin family protein [unclassified Bradyrhizobium]|uniref:hemolysin family protein n=1 Tax=unclassified Bradyrhizobium TaxID=2631580 RepID=UPI0003805243|nr:MULTISPECIES: hemolysin family protein [unclassified Bradyrhizobium]MBB4259046.1 CBS domain containing-hemolysin-like protein [Bradyrhizobium sp. CIR3A]MBB4424500.1 CBS domain containing-hemolysin-like protein [Bradyrhizobium sp. CIR48]NYG44332.1 CBS domain containing-hemolysin-like protein [Bradyrhizobium sp. IAR9]